MSITINLQKNNSDINRLDKNITNLSTITGVLKDSTSILNPVIKISGSIPSTCNYITIPDFGRSYFVTDIRTVTNNIYEITAHVDVLSTYKKEIRECTGIIARQERKWNLYIDDGSFKTYQNQIITIKKFPSGFSTQEFILAVAGG